ncbi:MAG: MBL fold metallo-hydrolase [Cyclobacteriaceae bacterium]
MKFKTRCIAFYIGLSAIYPVFPQSNQVSLVVLGTMQDGGSPHIGCNKDCCKELNELKKVVSIGILDHAKGKHWLIEATPDLPSQLKDQNKFLRSNHPSGTDGIFLSHAHIGHYSGLMFLGKEALGASNVAVYAMPRMAGFLNRNAPWSQLVSQKNISIIQMTPEVPVLLSDNLNITPIPVPHRDEFSETVGFIIQGPSKKVLFIPDIDKWEKWSKDVCELIKTTDIALIDGTFFSNAEIGYRDISEIPHPLVSESMEKFKDLDPADKKKIYFIHLNHTNPLLQQESKELKHLINSGFNVAYKGMKIEM